ncbi:MAG TPA: MFS transporter, partial [Rhodopila sp.]
MPTPISIDEDSLYARISWRILPLLMLSWLFSYIDRVNIGFAKLQMAQALHFSDAAYGFGAGIFFLGYFLFEVPSNLLLHRFGARIWISRIMITWAMVSGLTMFVQTPLQFYLMRFLLGLAEAGFIPGAVYYISTWYPSYRRGRVFGIFYLALAGSGLVGGPLAGTILSTMSGVAGIAGWKWLLLLEALPTLILGVLILLRLPENVQDVAWLSEPERKHVQTALVMEEKQKDRAPVSSILSNPVVWLLTFIYFLLNYAAYGLSFWLPTLIRDLGVTDNFDIGLVAAIPSLCSMICMVLFGRSADRHRERRWHLTAMFLIGAAGFIVSVLANGGLVVGVLGLCMAAICTQAFPSLFWAVPTAMLTGVTAAAGIAMINAIGNLSGFTGSMITAVAKNLTGDINNGTYALGACLLVSCGLILLVPRAMLA